MASEHRDKFMEAAKVEINGIESHGTWKQVSISSVKGTITPCIWIFSIKRSPDGVIKKFKARLCLRGDLQRGAFESYAPLASFSTVRIFLITSLMFGWSTCTK